MTNKILQLAPQLAKAGYASLSPTDKYGVLQQLDPSFGSLGYKAQGELMKSLDNREDMKLARGDWGATLGNSFIQSATGGIVDTNEGNNEGASLAGQVGGAFAGTGAGVGIGALAGLPFGPAGVALGATIGGSVFGGANAFGNTLRNYEDQGKPIDGRAYADATLQGGLSAIPVLGKAGSFASKLAPALAGRIAESGFGRLAQTGLGRLAGTALLEGGENALGELGSQAIQGQGFDTGNILKAGAIGAGVGAGLHVGTQGVSAVSKGIWQATNGKQMMENAPMPPMMSGNLSSAKITMPNGQEITQGQLRGMKGSFTDTQAFDPEVRMQKRQATIQNALEQWDELRKVGREDFVDNEINGYKKALFENRELLIGAEKTDFNSPQEKANYIKQRDSIQTLNTAINEWQAKKQQEVEATKQQEALVKAQEKQQAELEKQQQQQETLAQKQQQDQLAKQEAYNKKLTTLTDPEASFDVLKSHLDKGHSTALNTKISVMRGRYNKLMKSVVDGTADDLDVKEASNLENLLNKFDEHKATLKPQKQGKGVNVLDNQGKQQKLPTAVSEVEIDNTAKTVKGGESQAYDADGKAYDFNHHLVEAKDLITSNNEDFTPNEAYPQELQPRDRGRKSGQKQVEKMAEGLIPAKLMDSPDVANGSPIVGKDLVVESGNGRTMALRKAYKNHPDKAEAYRKHLKDNAEKLGLDPAKIDAMENPVLVRVRNTPVDRAEFGRKANESSLQQLSPIEQAKTDAKKLDNDVLDSLNPKESGDLNDEFIIDYVQNIVPENERSTMVTPEGNITATGLRRIENALVTKAFGDNEGASAISNMLDSAEESNKNIGKALVNVASTVVKTEQEMQAGTRKPLAISDDIGVAVAKYLEIKKQGGKVDDYHAQGKLIDDGLTRTQNDLLQVVDAYSRQPRKLEGFIKDYYAKVDEIGDPRQQRLFAIEDQTPAQIIERLAKKEGLALREIGEDVPYRREAEAVEEAPAEKSQVGDFEKWFGNSKAVDENGKPLALYHGSPHDFKNFDKKKIGSSTDPGIRGKGFYFTPNLKTAQAYAKGETGVIKKVFLKMDNPIDLLSFKNKEALAEHLGFDASLLNERVDKLPSGDYRSISVKPTFTGSFTSAIKEKGYDSIIHGTEYTVFEPSQIKEQLATPTTKESLTVEPKKTKAKKAEELGVKQDVVTTVDDTARRYKDASFADGRYKDQTLQKTRPRNPDDPTQLADGTYRTLDELTKHDKAKLTEAIVNSGHPEKQAKAILNTLNKAAQDGKRVVLNEGYNPKSGYKRSDVAEELVSVLGFKISNDKYYNGDLIKTMGKPKKNGEVSITMEDGTKHSVLDSDIVKKPQILIQTNNENTQFSTRRLDKISPAMEVTNFDNFNGAYASAYNDKPLPFSQSNALVDFVTAPLLKANPSSKIVSYPREVVTQSTGRLQELCRSCTDDTIVPNNVLHEALGQIEIEHPPLYEAISKALGC
jgi:hypothetical protein